MFRHNTAANIFSLFLAKGVDTPAAPHIMLTAHASFTL